MHPLPKLYLFLSSSIILLFISSCSISKYKQATGDRVFLSEKLLNPVLKPKQTLKYKATIDVLKNHLSGLLLVKQTDSATIHFVFVTELGMKMFDFTYRENKMNADYVFEPLNKPKLITSLMRNFENMFLLRLINKPACDCKNKNKMFYQLEKLPSEKTSVYLTIDSLKQLHYQELFNGRKRSSKINYSYTAPTSTNNLNNIYNHISCIQYGFIKIYIDLTAIQ